MTMTFVESDERYSTYKTEAGEIVYLRHGGLERMAEELCDLNVRALWIDFARHRRSKLHPNVLKARFVEHIRGLLVEEDQAAFVGWCFWCDHAEDEDDMTEVDDEPTCGTCQDDPTKFTRCERCRELTADTTTTLRDQEMCEGCIDDHYYFCEPCDGYYNPEWGEAHGEDHQSNERENNCDCPTKVERFTVPNGEDLLGANERVMVSLPEGIISEEGLGNIEDFGYTWTYSHFYTHGEYNLPDLTAEQRLEARDQMNQVFERLAEVGNEWQTKRGNYTRRLSRFAYKELGVKLPDDLLGHVGNIARDNSRGVDLMVAVTRDLNGSAYDFAHSGSCWWSEYNSSRCALKNNGGFGIRSFGEYGVTGRAWVLPLAMRQWYGDREALRPTFNTLRPDALVVFNGYGALDASIAARIVAQMYGWSYQKIGFECEPMYINNDNGYLVGPPEILEKHDGINYDLEPHESEVDVPQLVAA